LSACVSSVKSASVGCRRFWALCRVLGASPPRGKSVDEIAIEQFLYEVARMLAKFSERQNGK